MNNIIDNYRIGIGDHESLPVLLIKFNLHGKQS
jgi:hypothetical protein